MLDFFQLNFLIFLLSENKTKSLTNQLNFIFLNITNHAIIHNYMDIRLINFKSYIHCIMIFFVRHMKPSFSIKYCFFFNQIHKENVLLFHHDSKYLYHLEFLEYILKFICTWWLLLLLFVYGNSETKFKRPQYIVLYIL